MKHGEAIPRQLVNILDGGDCFVLMVEKFPKETVWKVKITITKASGYIALKKVGLYLEK